LNKESYDICIKNYLSLHYPNLYFSVLHEEFGAIPMTQNSFTSSKNLSVIPIGTMGGAVKASTGYAFKFIQEQTKQIAVDLAIGKKPNAVLKKQDISFMMPYF